MSVPTGPEPEPQIVQVVRRFKGDLLNAEADQMAEMASRWLAVERRLEGQIDALALELARLQEAGETVPAWKVYQLDRYRALVAQTQAEIRPYIGYADDLISQRQAEWGALGLENAADALMTAYGRKGMVGGFFDVLNPGVIEGMVGVTANGSPLRTLLAQAYPEAVDGVTQALVNAMAEGLNPREAARRMRDGLGMGLDRILLIARTEQLRVYRTSSRMQYQKSGVVSGYRRIATKDPRVCCACIIADGTEYSLEHDFDEHPAGRCSLVPIVTGFAPPAWNYGAGWLEKQDPQLQESILGPGRFNLWKEGQAELDDFVSRKTDDIWGGSLIPTPVSRLTNRETDD